MTNLDENPPLAVPAAEMRDGDAEGEDVEQDQEGVGDDGEDRLYVDCVRHGFWFGKSQGDVKKLMDYYIGGFGFALFRLVNLERLRRCDRPTPTFIPRKVS